MPKGVKKVSKVDMFLSTLAETVLANFFDGNRSTQVVLPINFTLEELVQVSKGAESFKHMVFTKEEGVKNISTSSVSFKIVDDELNIVIVSK